jgi:hypothetical protein
MDRYSVSGIIFITFGAPFAAYSYYILLNVPLAAVGLASVILGATVLMLPSSPVPRGTLRSLVEGGCVSVEAILEEFNAQEKGVYLPPREGRSWAYIPLSSNPGYDNVSAAMDAPVRVVTDAGGEPGLMVFPPGSEVVRLSMLGEEAGLEEALTYVLVDFLEAVEGVKATRVEDEVVIRFHRVRIDTEFPRYRKVLGSLPTSMAGTIISTVLGAPVRLMEENELLDGVQAIFGVMPDHG